MKQDNKSINSVRQEVAFKEDALAIINFAMETIGLTTKIESLAKRFGALGLKSLDALH